MTTLSHFSKKMENLIVMATRILSRTTTSCVSARFSTSVTSPEKMSANPLSIDNTSILSSSEFKDDAEKLLTSHDYFGMSTQPFSKEIAQILLAPLNEKDIEIKPDGIPYLPEIKYRRILNHGFGPGGWGLIPRSSHFCLVNMHSSVWDALFPWLEVNKSIWKLHR
jgi:predicted glycosyl hydrolase (DUF1957 family)